MSNPKEKATHKQVRLAIIRIEKGRPNIISDHRVDWHPNRSTHLRRIGST